MRAKWWWGWALCALIRIKRCAALVGKPAQMMGLFVRIGQPRSRPLNAVPYKTAFIIPSCRDSLSCAVEFVQQWADNQDAPGSAIAVKVSSSPRKTPPYAVRFALSVFHQTTFSGVDILFLPSPGARLSLRARKSGNAIVFEEAVELGSGTPAVHGLVQSASTSILDSFRSELMVRVGANPAGGLCFPESRGVVEVSEEDVDMDFVELHAKDLNSDLATHFSTIQRSSADNVADQASISATRILYQRPGCSAEASALVDQLHAWATKEYTTKGIGVEVTSLASGVRFSFLVDSAARLDVFVRARGEAVEVCAYTSPPADSRLDSILGAATAAIQSHLQEFFQGLSVAAASSSRGDPPSAAESLTSTEEALNTLRKAPVHAATSPMRNRLLADDAQSLQPTVEVARAQAASRELEQLLQANRQQGFLQIFQDNTSLPVADRHSTPDDLRKLFALGKSMSQLNLFNILNRPPADRFYESEDALAVTSSQFPMLLENKARLARGEEIDILSGPSGLTHLQTAQVGEPSEDGARIARQLEEATETDRKRLAFLLQELGRSPAEMHGLVLDGFRDLLLSEGFVALMQAANRSEDSPDKRLLYRLMIDKSASLHAEVALLIQEQSARHLKTIEQICEVAAAYQHDEAAFLDRMDLLKPLFDTSLLAYLTHAVEEEERRHARESVDAQLAPSTWLRVLWVVRSGVSAELQARFEHLIELLTFVVRFHDQPRLQEELLRGLVNATAPTDLVFLRQLALNMVDGVLSGVRRESQELFAEDAHLAEQMQRLGELVGAHLSDEVVSHRMQRYETEIAKQGNRVQFVHRNPALQHEMDSQRDSESAAALGGNHLIDIGFGG